MNILIKSALLVDATNKTHHLKKRDIHIKGGVIRKIASKISTRGPIEVVDLKNLHVSPGWFDSSVCFGEPGYEERETIANGLQVAAKSGFTDIVLNPNTFPVPDSSSDIVFLKNSALGHPTNLHPLGALTLESKGNKLAELFDMKNAGAVGFYDFKAPLENANLLKIALQYTRGFNGLVVSFPMNNQIAANGSVNEGATSTKLGLKGVPALAEELQVARDLFILEYTGGKLHIPTLSTAKSMHLIRDAKRRGLDVSCSVAVHNLFFTDDVLQSFDSNNKVLPPLRSTKEAKALAKGLESGIIDFVTSDHIPLDIEEKRTEFDNAGYGSLGLESAFGALNSLFDFKTTVDILCRGRKRFGIDQVATAEGSLANLTLFNPNGSYRFSEKNVQSRSKNSMFLGEELHGHVYGTIANNQMVLV